MKVIKIINGPNLNMLGRREAIYGKADLLEIEKIIEQKLSEQLKKLKIDLEWFQSNSEGEIINEIHKCYSSDYCGLVINPAAYSHTSIGIYDALKILEIPIVEVHLTNVHSREEFRRELLTARAASTIIGGAGVNSYYLGLLHILDTLP